MRVFYPVCQVAGISRRLEVHDQVAIDRVMTALLAVVSKVRQRVVDLADQ